MREKREAKDIAEIEPEAIALRDYAQKSETNPTGAHKMFTGIFENKEMQENRIQLENSLVRLAKLVKKIFFSLRHRDLKV